MSLYRPNAYPFGRLAGYADVRRFLGRRLSLRCSSDYIPLVDHRNSVVGAWDMMEGSLTEVADYTAQGRLTLRDELEQSTCAEEGNPGTLCDSPGGMPFAFNSRWRSPRTGLVNMCWERSDRMPLDVTTV